MLKECFENALPKLQIVTKTNKLLHNFIIDCTMNELKAMNDKIKLKQSYSTVADFIQTLFWSEIISITKKNHI